MPIRYDDKIRENLDQLRHEMWQLCLNDHADVALTASREALGTISQMRRLLTARGETPPDHFVRKSPGRPKTHKPKNVRKVRARASAPIRH